MDDFARRQTEAMYLNAFCIAALMGLIVGLAMYMMTECWELGCGVGLFISGSAFWLALWGPHE